MAKNGLPTHQYKKIKREVNMLGREKFISLIEGINRSIKRSDYSEYIKSFLEEIKTNADYFIEKGINQIPLYALNEYLKAHKVINNRLSQEKFQEIISCLKDEYSLKIIVKGSQKKFYYIDISPLLEKSE